MRQNRLRETIARAAQLLADAGVPSPDVDARLIAAHLLGVPPPQLVLAEPTESFGEEYSAMVRRRARREPLQHILGTAAFGIHDLRVGPGVFIPRPETEVLAQWAVDQKPGGTVVDLGTGSGALAIYIAERVTTCQVFGVEKSPVARAVAETNAAAFPNVRIIDGDMTDPELLTELSGAVDLVVANPPYVPFVPQEAGELEPEVYHDPAEAVFSGEDGMDAIRGLIPVAARLLAPGGTLGIEHDDTTSDATHRLVESAGVFKNVRNMADLTGRDRFVTASKLRTN